MLNATVLVLQDSRYYDAALSILSSLAGSYLASDDSEAMLAYNGEFFL